MIDYDEEVNRIECEHASSQPPQPICAYASLASRLREERDRLAATVSEMTKTIIDLQNEVAQNDRCAVCGTWVESGKGSYDVEGVVCDDCADREDASYE